MEKFYLTTAIPYVNAPPHIGFALEVVQADVVARYYRELLGEENVRFLTGTDENSLKNVQAAEKEGISTQSLVDRNAKRFFDLKKALNLSFDDFIRTTEKRHVEGATALWRACQKDIYKKKYCGLYCVGCEAFYDEKDLVGGKCPEHKTKPEVVEEENYFFRLSKYQKWLYDLIVSGKLEIVPEIRKNEILSFIRRGLQDFSVSRSKKRAHGWGIPVPGDPEQIIYVWFDALANYITALEWQENSSLYKKYWPADVHVIGKGITRFHAIYWPAMLKSAHLPLPKAEFVHGYVTVDGQKISKSLGNVIDPFALVKQYGTDPIRYYLLREIPAYGDGDFSLDRFKEVYNADLANGLGNLVARVAKLCQTKNYSQDGPKLPQPFRSNCLKKFQFDLILEEIWKEIKSTDILINNKKPWEKPDKEAQIILASAVKSILSIASALRPFLPETAETIIKQFANTKIKVNRPLFPRL